MKRKYVWLLLCVMFMFAACGPQENDEKTESAAEVVADAGEEKTVQPDKEPEKEPEKTPEKPPADACTTYCDNVTTNCTGANKVYADKAACMAACKAMPEGSPDDKKGNSAWCRAYHAGAPAKADPAAHCPHASIASEADTCGTPCEAYCDQVTTNCTGDNAQHKDKAECLDWCKGKPAGKWNDISGDSISCRAYHSSFPAAADAKTHCPHAGKDGGGVCGKAATACDTYCTNVMDNCKDANKVYADKASCMAACNAMPEGKADDKSGNTAYCRAYHAGAPAKGDAKTHCPHAGISSSGDTCGTPCEAYCDQVTKNCTGANAQHKDKAECLTWCKGKTAGNWNDTSGDTIACRAYHASFPAAGDAKTHCPHAGKDGGGVCGVPATPCETYCSNVMTNCTGDNAVYGSKAACLSACAAMPVGKPDDKAGNTVYCRAYHAGAPAKADAKTHCPHAGISSSGGVCGSACDAYCDQVSKNCIGGDAQHKDRAACMTWCKGKTDGNWNDTSGNTIACRAYHASFPAAGDASTHCPHAGIEGAGICSSACVTYCTNVLANCTGANAIYANNAACMAACKSMPEGKPADKAGNTVWCRAYHAGAPAKNDPKTHCPHAGISSSAGVCGSACDAYCDQVTANCTNLNAQHNDRAACMTWCKSKSAGQWNDTTGDTIACRAYHASFPAASSADTHCPHAGISGGGVCVDPVTPCNTYCNNVRTNCTGANQVYANDAACKAACAAMPVGKPGDTSGNTVYCRGYHAGAPAKSAPQTHCQHAGISSSGGICGSPCDAYCDQVTKNCKGVHAQHKDRAACMTWCKGQTAGAWNTTSGNSIACRAYHASFPAKADPKTHCPHAGITGGGVCGTVEPPCETYCKNVMANCTGSNAVYAKKADCLVACKSMPIGNVGDKAGNTVYCRAYHAGAPAKSAPATHCPHAGISSSGGVCGSACDAFCDQVTANCTGSNKQFTHRAACMTWCKGKPAGKWNDVIDNTVACRAYHASFPAAAAPGTHCSHAGPSGGGVCADNNIAACNLYCKNVRANCTGVNQVFANDAACQAACKAIPAGKTTDKSGNTVYCRAYHAGAPAKADPKTHCQHAGISSSGGVCGSTCDAYCNQVTKNCTGANAQHASKSACLKWCAGKTSGAWNATSGDSIACRAYHGSFPATSDPKTHCPHAGITGGGACGTVEPPCETYCKNVMANCTGSNAVYAKKADCMAACAAMPVGNAADKAGNSSYCRAYHADGPAKTDAKTHCPHAGISSSGGVCGSVCDAFCDQVTANCTGANAQFANRGACMTWCSSQTSGNWNDTKGNTIACRAYHASFPAKADAKTHCPHAGPSGGGVCASATPTYKCSASFAGCTTYTDRTAAGASREVSFGGGLGLSYSPKCIKIKKGQTITFKGSFAGHPLKASCEEATAIPATNSGTTKTVTFNTPGYYSYYCTFHSSTSGSGMAGSIFVEP